MTNFFALLADFPGGLDFEENVGFIKNFRLDTCPHASVGGVQKSSRWARAGLHHNLQARLGELRNELGNQCHAPFARGRLFRNADDHLRLRIEGKEPSKPRYLF
jgi:hypothetical protein